PGGSTPTPTPGPPTLNFSPSNVAPWNGSEWRVTGAQGTTRATVVANQSWNVTQTAGTVDWLRVERSGESLEIRVIQPNRTGIIREATVTVSSGSLTRELRIAQTAVVATMRGQRVIECFSRRGYIDVSSTTTSTIRYAAKSGANYPIWYFVHIADNFFAIRNDTTRRYLTETGGSLRHDARISGVGRDYDNRQRWLLLPQANGTYRIRSVSNPTLYIEDGPAAVMLSPRNTSNNWQLWWIENIWHIGAGAAYQEWFGIWDRVINIRREPLGTPPAGFDFIASMNRAQNIWSRELGVTFNPVADLNDANIRAYGGDRYEIADRINGGTHFSPTGQRYGFFRFIAERDVDTAGRIQAGGMGRNVNRLHNTGDNAVQIAVFSNSGSWDTRDYRNVRFATMTALHELGHALGYFGHSPNPNDIMRGNIQLLSNPSETLRPAELEHLRQAYRFRRQANPFIETDVYSADKGSGNYE
ncbi:MAG: RICIN domain-containing protein, partial [Oscillospiraceae bacterium]|nr:RICIN domain-containing protein [Oscillospiraceae bacterium]